MKSSFLNQPYPYLFSLKRDLIIALTIGVLVAVINFLSFNYAVDASTVKFSEITISILTGMTTFLGILTVTQFIPHLFFSIDFRENWTIKKELTLIITILIFITLINHLLFTILITVTSGFSFSTQLIKAFGFTLLIGIPPTFLIIWINYTIILRRNLSAVKAYNTELKKRLTLPQKASEPTFITIATNNVKEQLKIDPKSFVLAKADGNYLEIYEHSNENIQRSVYRLSIQQMTENLVDFPFIFSPHRSFIINLNYISNTSGNARNYRLSFKGISFDVPVSRGKFDAFHQAFSAHSVNE